VSPKRPHLKRELGLFQAVAAGVGIILGAGIYVLIGQAAGVAGNAVWLSFLLGALIAACTGLSYAELSSMYPKDAGEYLYTEKAFSEKLGWLTAFLIVFQGIVSAAAVALGFGGYLSRLLEPYFIVPIILLALFCVLFFSWINYRGIKETARFNTLFTLIEVGGLILIIFAAIKSYGRVNIFELTTGMSGVLSAASLIFFAYIGFESIVKLSEETKSPQKIIPRALVWSIIISTILYILTAIAAVSLLDWNILATSKAPLADAAATVFGSNAFLVLALIALFSTANTVLMILVTTSRMLFTFCCWG